MKNQILFVVDTDKYTGNFERELCAYITGIVGECGVGEDESDIFAEEVGNDEIMEYFEDVIQQYPDDNGTYRPATSIPSPLRSGYSGVGIFLYYIPRDHILTLMCERAKKYGKLHKIKIEGFRIIKRKVVEISSVLEIENGVAKYEI